MDDDPLDGRLPVELDYGVRDRRVTNITKMRIMLRIADDLHVEGADETKWRTALSAKILGGITRAQNELESV